MYSGWYGYREFSDGPIPGLGSHFIDLLHFVTGARFPQSCTCLGGTFTWKDEHRFTCPDHVEALWVYPEGFMAALFDQLRQRRRQPHLLRLREGDAEDGPSMDRAQLQRGAARSATGASAAKTRCKPIDGPDHWLDWLQCMRSGKTPIAPLDAGYQHAVAVIMAMQSYDAGMRMIYDHARREIRQG